MSKIYQALERFEGRWEEAAEQLPERRADGHRSRPDANEYERLGSKIMQARAVAPFQTVMLASPDPGEGTSTVAVGLATTLAHRGLQVLLVDANFRRPGLADMLGVVSTAGFAGLLGGHGDPDGAIASTGTTGLAVLPAGEAGRDAPRLLDTARLSSVQEQLRSRADVIIFDAPPVLPYADALTIAACVDRVVLVTQADHTQRGHLERASEELHGSGASILGVVLNRKRSHAPPWLERCFNL